MTIESEINRIKQNIANCYTTLTAKGATIPAVENVANLAACIRTIPTGAADNFVTQSGDTIITSAGTPLALDGISSLTTAPSITDTQLTFADDGNSTVSFSMQQLKDYVSPAPSGTTLHQYDRVDGKATVAGFWTRISDGKRYAVVVADAQYRSGGQNWGTVPQDTELPNYITESQLLKADNSALYNTNVILNYNTPTDYPAFNAARNACTVSVDNKTFVGCLPNAAELQMVYNDKATLDTYDTTLTDYSNNSLTTWNIGGNSNSRCWSSNEFADGRGWALSSSNRWNEGTLNNLLGVIPVFEIPVDENGTVITN